MANVVYFSCAILSIACALLLLRGYAASNARLLLWSSLCFVGLAINNILLVVDKVFIPDVDLYGVRTGTAVVAIALLVYGLVWDAN